MQDPHTLNYVVVTDYLSANTGEDLSDAIQKIIDDNPRRTIFFPDGEYIISKPILTGGSYMTAVSLMLSNFAVIKASQDWSDEEAMIRLGGKDRAFRITAVGTNNFFCGGVLDGSGRAKGMSIDSGREYSIRNVSMKYVTMGLRVKYNPEYGSNDSDIFNVNIVGVGLKDSIGLLIEGFDSTFTNMRIANFQTGVKITGSGNFLRNIHPLFIYCDDGQFAHEGSMDYKDSVGFDDPSSGNVYDVCYPDNFATGFRMVSQTLSTYNDCFCYWYSSRGGSEVAFRSEGRFNSIIKSGKIDFRGDTENAFLSVAEHGGSGVISNPMFNEAITQNKDYVDYVEGRIVWQK